MRMAIIVAGILVAGAINERALVSHSIELGIMAILFGAWDILRERKK